MGGEKKRVWDSITKDTQKIGFLQLNVIDDYNQQMNSTDIANQLRGLYHPDHWFQNRKWWWAIFVWAIGVAGVSAYKIYNAMYDKTKKDNDGQLPLKWMHMQFLEELVVYDLIFLAEMGMTTMIE